MPAIESNGTFPKLPLQIMCFCVLLYYNIFMSLGSFIAIIWLLFDFNPVSVKCSRLF